MKRFIASVSIALIFLAPAALRAQQSALRVQINTIARSSKGIVGVSLLGLEDRDTLTVNGNARLVMESVFKFPVALTVLHLVDSGKFTLTQLIHIRKKDLPKTYSPLRDKYPNGDVDVSIADLLSYMVSLSDNNACDILISKVTDGMKPVQDYILRTGVRGIALRATEADMSSSPELQYANWCKPGEMTVLLDKFYKGEVLSKASTEFLNKLMVETTTGPKRIKGLLPAGTTVAHKTGSSGTNAAGVAPGTNDVGIITLPNGKHLAIAVFVCNSTDDEATRDAVTAKIAKAAWDAYAK